MPSRFKIPTILLGIMTLVLAALNPLQAEEPILGYSAPWPAKDGYPYYGQIVPFSWVDVTNGTLIRTYDGEYFSLPLPVGFSFPYYNQSFSTFYLNANGFITFDPQNLQIDYSLPQCPLPSSMVPNNIIAPLWGDLGKKDDRSPLEIYYKTFGTCPVGSPAAGACLIVEYLNAHFELTKEKAGTFEVILYQNGDIVFQYLDVGVTLGQGSNLYTVGIENTDANQGYGLTYLCDAPYLLNGGTALKFDRTFLLLTPETLNVKSCNGQAADYTFFLTNATEAAGTFTLACSTSTPGAAISCPPSVYAGNKETVPVAVTLTPPACTPPGLQITGILNAAGNGYTGQALLAQALYQTGIWDQIPPEPEYCRQDIVAGTYGGKVWSIAGKGSSTVRNYNPATRQWSIVAPNFINNLDLDNYARSGCQHGSKVFFYGDRITAGFEGLWSFDMATNPPTVKRESIGGPFPGLFGPAWSYDPEAELCYLTGGGGSPDSSNPNTFPTVFVYDPKTNTWPSTLPNFTTSRKLHAAFLYKRPGDNHKLLCVAGGINTNSSLNTPLASTQCYDISGGNVLNGENADLGPLPATRWGMGYTQRLNGGTQPQLWLVAGVLPGDQLTDSTLFYDVTGGSWRNGGYLASGEAYRSSAVTLNEEIIKLGGLFEFSQVCSADHYKLCSSCGWWTDQTFLPVIRK